MTQVSKAVRIRSRLGFYAAIGACAASSAYGVAQILQISSLVPPPLDRWLIFVPSLMLAPLFALAVAASAAEAPRPVRALRFGALGMAIAYAVLVSALYILQLGVVLPSEARGDSEAIATFICCDVGRPLTAVDLLGYTYMSLATFLLGASFHAPALRWSLIANGLLAPVILLQLVWPSLIVWASPWLFLFPLAMALLACDFACTRVEILETSQS